MGREVCEVRLRSLQGGHGWWIRGWGNWLGLKRSSTLCDRHMRRVGSGWEFGQSGSTSGPGSASGLWGVLVGCVCRAALALGLNPQKVFFLTCNPQGVKYVASKIRFNGFFELNQMVFRTPQITYPRDT